MFFRRRPYDIILEAVHYGPDGKTIEWARGYERIFSHYTDRRIFTRQDLIRALRQGKRIAVGRRKPLMGNQFDILGEVTLAPHGNDLWLVLKDTAPDAPRELWGVPQL
ncbi:MAG: hypothetical protein GXO37_01320, partial [Chloroflexi bacterium]|nr:hypothetical protein [Chloroflexota bacterium]